jgi:hypothetical protein
VVGLGQFLERLRAQLAVLRQTLVHQPGQQVALLLQHLPALLEKAHLAADLQQRTFGGGNGQALLHGNRRVKGT